MREKLFVRNAYQMNLLDFDECWIDVCFCEGLGEMGTN